MYLENFVIRGGHELFGEVNISGAKNAAVAIIPAAILADDVVRIENIPNISDVSLMIQTLDRMGAKIKLINNNTIEIDSRTVTYKPVPYELASHFRASYYLIGVMLGRFKKAEVAMPGGCAIGERRVDFHIRGLEALGAKIKIENGYVHAKVPKLVGTDIYLDIPSVGATENLMLASILADGSTRIQNAAQEPEIVDLANFLNTMGADVNGAGTSEIVINGVKQDDLHPIEYTTIPDRIEAGTFMSAIIATRGKAVIKNVFPAHLTFFTDKLLKMGANIKLVDPNVLEVSCKNRLNSINFITQPYPGFPTDLQSMAMTLLTTANGVGIITESLYENRFMQVPELRRMGADIHQDRNHAIIKGVKKLTGATLAASDLRAGASLVVAALMADGNSTIENLHHIDRGYENFENKLRLLGGKIERKDDAIINPATVEPKITEGLL